MSSTPSLQCLFCKRLNPASAIFCNECGTQLNLQPCEQCGAIDDRAAQNCYKCGAEFTPAHALQTDVLSMPSDPDKDGSPPALNDVVAAGQQDRQDQQDQQVSYPNGLNQPPLGLQPVNDKVAPATSGATVIGSRRRRSVAITVLMLALIAIVAAVYLLNTQPAQPAQKSAGATPSSVAPSVAQSSAGAARTVPPLPVTDAQIKPRQALPIVNECSQAVATLGLCSPATNQEKP